MVLMHAQRGDYVWAFHDSVEIGPKMLVENRQAYRFATRRPAITFRIHVAISDERRSDSTLDIGEIQPDLHAAEV